jgi:glycosyltransferase involved in cell wall biosynthesis
MNLLIITQLIPYPLSEGGRVSQYALIDYLRQKCSITLAVFVYNDADESSVQHLKKNWENVAFELISMRPLTPIRRIRTVRNLIRSAFKAVLHKANISYDKLFPSESSLSEEDAEMKYATIINLVDFVEPRLKKNIDKIAELVDRIKPDLVQIEFVYLLDLSFCIPKEIKKIFVHHELRFKRVETEMAVKGKSQDLYAYYLKKLCEISEIGLLKNFDAIATVSEDDRNLLLQKLPDKNIRCSPFPVLDSEFVAIQSDYLVIEKLVFVGGESHYPNKDAVEWYINNISEMIRQKYGFTLHVIGKWSEETICKYKGNNAVCFTGYVENLSEYCRNSILVVPLRIGSGIRVKILYAVAAGVPVVSTTLGSEGIFEHDKICIAANTPDQFVDAIGKINSDGDFTESLVSNAQLILKKHYSQQVAGHQRLELYKSVLEMAAALPIE